MTRRRVAVVTVGAAVAARVWWRSGNPPWPLKVGVLIYGMRGRGDGEPEPVRSGRPSEVLP